MQIANCINKTKQLIKLYLSSEDGTSAIEYAVIASLVSVAIVGAVGSIGSTMSSTIYNDIVANLTF